MSKVTKELEKLLARAAKNLMLHKMQEVMLRIISKNITELIQKKNMKQ